MADDDTTKGSWHRGLAGVGDKLKRIGKTIGKKDENGTEIPTERDPPIRGIVTMGADPPSLLPQATSSTALTTLTSSTSTTTQTSTTTTATPSRKSLAPPASKEPLVSPSGRPEKGPKGGGAEDMKVMMDQLSNLSTLLADALQAKSELDTEVKKLRQQKEKLTTELESSKKSATDWEQKYESVKAKVVYEKVQEGQLELKKLKEEKATLLSDLENAKQTIEELTSTLKEKSEECKRIEEDKEKERKCHEKTASELETERGVAADLLTQLQDAQQEKKKLEADWKIEKADAELKFKKLEEDHKNQVAALTAQTQVKIKELSDNFDKMQAERNAFKTKAEGAAKDLKRVLQTKDHKKDVDSKLAQENARLKEELTRKSKSLSDAMQALALYMQEADSGAGPEGPSLEALKDLGRKEPKNVLKKENTDLQHLANKLSSTINERDIQVTHLRSINSVLGKRLIELEKKLGLKPGEGMPELPPEPDFTIMLPHTPSRKGSLSTNSLSSLGDPPITRGVLSPSPTPVAYGEGGDGTRSSPSDRTASDELGLTKEREKPEKRDKPRIEKQKSFEGEEPP